MLDLNAIISSTLADGTHVWVLLKGNILKMKIIEDIDAMA